MKQVIFLRLLKLWMVSLLPEESSEFMHSTFGRAYDNLSSKQQIILCTAYVEKQVTNSRLQPLLEAHSIDVAKNLNYLVESHFLIRNNNGRWTTYEINDSYVKEPSPDQVMAETGPSWDQVGIKSGPSWDQAKRILLFCLSDRTLLEIMGEMKVASRNKFRMKFILPLLSSSMLERTVPDKPNSSNQKYRTTSKGKELLNQQ